MVGLYLTIFLSGCLFNTLTPTFAYHLSPRGEGALPTNQGESEGFHGEGSQGEESGHLNNAHEGGIYPPNNHHDSQHPNNVQGAETYNNQGGVATNPNYQQGVAQNPSYHQGNPPNYQQEASQVPNYGQGTPQAPNYGQGTPQAPNYLQGNPPSYQQGTYQQGLAQNPAYQQGGTAYNAPGQGEPHEVLSHDNPEELVKNKSDSELRKLVLKALKEMKDIAEKVAFWHQFHSEKKHDDSQSQQNQPPLAPQLPQGPYRNAPQPYYNQNPPPYQPYYTQRNPQQYYNMAPQNQPMQPQYGGPNYGQTQPYNQGQPQPYNQAPPLPYNQAPPQPYISPYRQIVQYTPQPYYNQQQQQQQQQQLQQQFQPSIVIPPGTFQYQRLVQHLYANLQPLLGQPEGVSQQYYTYKLWTAPQQQAESQLSDTQQSSGDNQQTQISIPVTLPTMLAKDLQSQLHLDNSYVPRLVHVPPGFVVTTPTHYVLPYARLPEVSAYRSHLQYGFPLFPNAQ